MQKDILRNRVLNNQFCTISTSSHLFKCFALADSLAPYNGHLNILLVDDKEKSFALPKNVKVYNIGELHDTLAKQISTKYSNKPDCLRWSLKSVFLKYLLNFSEKVIYIDNDIYFFTDPNFLFDQLDQNNILLTPHHYPRNPEENQQWLEANFKVGLFNAGFIGVNNKAIETLTWWAKACLYRCEKNNWRGLFDDQKYLDLVPIIEPKTKILEHKGCNVAEWNRGVCVQKETDEGVIINNKYPLVFYHFNNYSLNLLSPSGFLASTYLKALQQHNIKLSYEDLIYPIPLTDQLKLFIWKLLNKWNG